MNNVNRAKWIGCNIAAGIALACSGEPDIVSLEPSGLEDVSFEASDRVLEDEALLRAPVTSEEMLVLEDYFARSGLGAPTSMEGRLLSWDDAMMTVDDVLFRASRMNEPALNEPVSNERDLIDKAYVNTVAANPSGVNAIEFWRPDIGGLYYIIVEDTVPNYVFNAISAVYPDWTGLATDCLGFSAFQVIRRTAYNALSQNQKDVSYEIEFRFITTTAPGWNCQGNFKACMRFPGTQSIKVNGAFVNRMAVGNILTVDSATFPSSAAEDLKKTLRHELGHGLGFAHQEISNATHHLPGTISCGITCADVYPSVMRFTSQGGGVFNASDDKKAMRTLYADEPNRNNDGCAYVDGFRVLNALP